MEIFVSHNALDIGVVRVGRGGGVGKNKLGVENIQTLVFHRAHIEVAGCNDHETLQVQAQAKTVLVPCHAGHQRIHGMFGFVEITWANIDLQQVLFT